MLQSPLGCYNHRVDIDERLKMLAESADKLAQDIDEMRPLVDGIARGTARLLRSVEGHERRFDSNDDLQT